MRPTVFLFDIDGTLLNSEGAGRRAMTRAFDERHGRADACAGIAFGGMTDRAILREGLTAIGVAPSEPTIDALLQVYLGALKDELERSRACSIPAGVVAALDAIEGEPGKALGLGTGNIEEGARLKLRKVGLAERFPFGGFGCDHEDRALLLAVGAERGAARLGVTRSSCRVVIVGDTPKDIAAARAIGAECLAVATGTYAETDLAPHGPTWVFPHLASPGALAALLEGRSP